MVSIAMTPVRLNECLFIIGWSGNRLANHLGLNERTVRRWLAGRNPVPASVGDWLEKRVDDDLVRWLPDEWQPRSVSG